MEPDLSPPQIAAIRRVLEDAKFELFPMKNVRDQIVFLPERATVSVTASPAKTLEDTLDLAADLQQRGHEVVPHLSARMTRDRAHLEKLVVRMDELAIRKIFVIGGDAEYTGEFSDAGSLLRAITDIGATFDEIGVAAYPEGHHVFDDATALMALQDKQQFATSMTTQMCFDTSAIAGWLDDMRGAGVTLSAYVGVPGVADRLKLMRISARIGVGRSLKFLARHRGLLRNFAEPGRYSPVELLEGLAPTLTDPRADIMGVHIYTFNQVETTERWRQDYLASLQ